jgi:hypothetical protein
MLGYQITPILTGLGITLNALGFDKKITSPKVLAATSISIHNS